MSSHDDCRPCPLRGIGSAGDALRQAALRSLDFFGGLIADFCQALGEFVGDLVHRIGVGIGTNPQRLMDGNSGFSARQGQAVAVPGPELDTSGERGTDGNDRRSAEFGQTEDAGLDGVARPAGAVDGDGQAFARPNRLGRFHQGTRSAATAGTSKAGIPQSPEHAGEHLAIAALAGDDTDGLVAIAPENGEVVAVPERIQHAAIAGNRIEPMHIGNPRSACGHHHPQGVNHRRGQYRKRRGGFTL